MNLAYGASNWEGIKCEVEHGSDYIGSASVSAVQILGMKLFNLHIWGKAQHEAARRPTSELKYILGRGCKVGKI